MRILVVGASGLIGKAVADYLDGEHDVIRASRGSGERVDIADTDSVRALYERVGTVDAVVGAAGSPPFGPLSTLGVEDYRLGIAEKALGQIDLVAQGSPHVTDRGSFTLISGILAQIPIAGSAAAGAANGAVESFAVSAATELPRGQRINVVSPTVLKEATGVHSAFPGFRQVSAAEVVQAYVRSIAGVETGKILRLWG